MSFDSEYHPDADDESPNARMARWRANKAAKRALELADTLDEALDAVNMTRGHLRELHDFLELVPQTREMLLADHFTPAHMAEAVHQTRQYNRRCGWNAAKKTAKAQADKLPRRKADNPFRTKVLGAPAYGALRRALREYTDERDALRGLLQALEKVFQSARQDGFREGWLAALAPEEAARPTSSRKGVPIAPDVLQARRSRSAARAEIVSQMAYRTSTFRFPWKDAPLTAKWVLCDPVAHYIGPDGVLCKTIAFGSVGIVPDGPCSVAFAAPEQAQ